MPNADQAGKYVDSCGPGCDTREERQGYSEALGLGRALREQGLKGRRS